MNAVMAAVILVLGASAAPRAMELQVEAVTATGASLPELGDAVARALVMGGARVVMRGPNAGPCLDCTLVKVTELGAGAFKVEVKAQDNLAATTLDLSTGTRLLDRARAIAIHVRLLTGRPAAPAAKGPETAASAPRKSPEVKPAPPREKSKAPVPLAPVALAASVTAPEPSPAAAPSPPPAPPTAGSEPTRLQVSQGEAKSPSRGSEAKRPVVAESTNEKERAPTRREGVEAAPARADLLASPVPRASRAQWPWIPTAIGAGAVLGAGVCAFMARQKYDDLSDRDQSLDSARSLKSSGETWQTAAFVLSGVAVAGLGVGIVGFATRSAGGPTVKAVASPMPGGGMAMMAWGLP